MASVTVDFEDKDTVAIRIDDSGFFGLATDKFDVEFEERGMQGGAVTVAELSLRPATARALFLRLAEALTEEV
jgi:hypothetical protein